MSRVLLGLLALVACRPSSSDRAPPPPPASPPARHATAPAKAGTFAFPLEPASATALRAVPAFPRLALDRPLWVGSAPGDDGHLWVVEQAGRILRFDARADVATYEVMADVRDRVRMQHNEEGLLGLAFDPDFARSRALYLYYSASGPRRTQLSRFSADPRGRIDPASERVLLRIEQPWGNHNGGALAFGPDGMLYVGVGDGGAANDPHANGQDLGTLLGTILRLSVEPDAASYRVPADNPFVDTAGARPEIWAYGLRNPWRFSFDRSTGALWVGDVGQDSLEEVDLVTRGGNYGWNAREGTQPFASRTRGAGMIDPVTEYGRREGESITGGYVYRGTALADFRGMYVFGDYVTGEVWAIDPTSEDPSHRTRVARVPSVSSFGEDAAGELYATSFDGRVYRFEAVDPEAATRRFPTALSQTGLFEDLAALAPAPGLLAYDVALPFWSDGADKQRWLALPAGGRVEVDDDGAWSLPVGAITVKHFELPLDDADPTRTRRLETRVMVHERGGWAGYTYRWNDAQTDAELVTSPTRATYRVRRGGEEVDWGWSYPAGADCLRCHTPTYGEVLGLRARQIDPGGALVQALTASGRLSSPPPSAMHPALDDDAVDLSARARAWLDVNCAPCHHPGGPAPGGIDLRVQTPLADTHLRATPPEDPVGVAGERRVAPGAHARSSLWLRPRRRDDPKAMPPLASLHVDETGTALIARWIDAMK